MANFRDIIFPFLVGALLHIGLWVGVGWLYSHAVSSVEPGNGVVTISMPWFELLRTLLPGLVAGYLCKRRPLAIGFTAIVAASLAMYPSSWHPVVGPGDLPLVVQAIDGAIRSGIVGAIAAAAGFFLANRLGANNSFKPKPLRGSA